MIAELRLIVGALGFGILVLLPGAWITFGLALKGLSFRIKLLAGIMLAPIVIAIQFYLIRWLGVSFELTVFLLVILNLPPLYLMYRQRSPIHLPDRNASWMAAIIAIIILGSIAPFLTNPQERLYTWEAWTQSDVIYSLSNGNLVLEDAELAGVRLAYPWIGHVYQAVLSYSLGTSPVTNYIWSNLIWLVVIFGFAAAIVEELGGNQLSQVTTAIWLSFGVNIIGYWVSQVLPPAWFNDHPNFVEFWGDNRFTPWLDKILFFGQMYFALGLFIAILYLMLKRWDTGSRRNFIIVTGLMLCALGLIYPVLLPPALAVVVARTATLVLSHIPFFNRNRIPSIASVEEIPGLSLAMAVACVVTIAYTKFLTDGRTGATLFTVHEPLFMRTRTVATIIALSPLLIGLIIALPKIWNVKRNLLIVLALGAVSCSALYILFDIPWYQNEYKFIFLAAICLAPFPSLAMEPILNRLGRGAFLLMAVLSIVVAYPLATHVYFNAYPMYTLKGPPVDASHFDLRLDETEPLAGLLQTVRLETPTNTVVVVDDAELHLPTLISRSLYVAPSQKTPYPGVLATSDDTLILAKGYSAQTVQNHRSIVKLLYEASDTQQMNHALEIMFEANRPLALILSERQDALLEWLENKKIGKLLYRQNGTVLWLVFPSEVPSIGTIGLSVYP